LASVFRNRRSRSLHPMLAVPLSIAAIAFEARSDIAPENAIATALVEGDRKQSASEGKCGRPAESY
jgi:hypothetical protein